MTVATAIQEKTMTIDILGIPPSLEGCTDPWACYCSAECAREDGCTELGVLVVTSLDYAELCVAEYGQLCPVCEEEYSFTSHL